MSTTLTKSKTKEHTAATGNCMCLLAAHHSQTYIRRRTDIIRRRKNEEEKRRKEEEEKLLTKWQQQQSDVRPFPINRPVFLTMLSAKLSGRTARHMYRHLVIYDDTERRESSFRFFSSSSC